MSRMHVIQQQESLHLHAAIAMIASPGIYGSCASRLCFCRQFPIFEESYKCEGLFSVAPSFILTFTLNFLRHRLLFEQYLFRTFLA